MDFILLFQVSHSSLVGLRSWKSPAVPSSSFSASQFRVFLPPKNKVEVGDTWWVIPSELNIFTGYLPNNRYHPPAPKGKEVSWDSSVFKVGLGRDSWWSYCTLIAVFSCRFSFTPCWVCSTLGPSSNPVLLLRAQSPAFGPAMIFIMTSSSGEEQFRRRPE